MLALRWDISTRAGHGVHGLGRKDRARLAGGRPGIGPGLRGSQVTASSSSHRGWLGCGVTAGEPVTDALVVAVSFIDQINRRDFDALTSLMSSDHRLEVLDEGPLVGKSANTDAWRGYFKSFPRNVIHPHRIAEANGRVAILGTPPGRTSGYPTSKNAHSHSSGSRAWTMAPSPDGNWSGPAPRTALRGDSTPSERQRDIRVTDRRYWTVGWKRLRRFEQEQEASLPDRDDESLRRFVAPHPGLRYDAAVPGLVGGSYTLFTSVLSASHSEEVFLALQEPPFGTAR